VTLRSCEMVFHNSYTIYLCSMLARCTVTWSNTPSSTAVPNSALPLVTSITHFCFASSKKSSSTFLNDSTMHRFSSLSTSVSAATQGHAQTYLNITHQGCDEVRIRMLANFEQFHCIRRMLKLHSHRMQIRECRETGVPEVQFTRAA